MRAIQVSEIDALPIIGGSMRWHPVRRALGIRAFGTNAYSAANAGDRVVEEHTEQAAGHEEVYLVLEGRAEFTLGEESVDAPAGTLVFVRDPAVQRGAVAAESGTTVIAFGGPPGAPYQPLVWEIDFAAQGPYDAGDFDRAYEVASQGLDEFGDSARLHYNLACYANRAGHEDVALDHLRRAAELDPALVREWAPGDEDVASIRERIDLGDV